jgi:triosephosphate isomerase
MVFVKNLKEGKKIEKLNPDYLIYEPPELIEGNISVSVAKPEIIKKFSKT